MISSEFERILTSFRFFLFGKMNAILCLSENLKSRPLPAPCRPLQLHLQLDSNDTPLTVNEPYNAVDATSMRVNPTGKSECDRKMLAELNKIVPKGRREKVD